MKARKTIAGPCATCGKIIRLKPIGGDWLVHSVYPIAHNNTEGQPCDGSYSEVHVSKWIEPPRSTLPAKPAKPRRRAIGPEIYVVKAAGLCFPIKGHSCLDVLDRLSHFTIKQTGREIARDCSPLEGGGMKATAPDGTTVTIKKLKP